MMMFNDNKKLAQAIASKVLKKSKDNPEISEKVPVASNSYDDAKMEVVKDFMGALESKDAGKLLSAFKALHVSCSGDIDEPGEGESNFPVDNYGKKLADENKAS